MKKILALLYGGEHLGHQWTNEKNCFKNFYLIIIFFKKYSQINVRVDSPIPTARKKKAKKVFLTCVIHNLLNVPK